MREDTKITPTHWKVEIGLFFFCVEEYGNGSYWVEWVITDLTTFERFNSFMEKNKDINRFAHFDTFDECIEWAEGLVSKVENEINLSMVV